MSDTTQSRSQGKLANPLTLNLTLALNLTVFLHLVEQTGEYQIPQSRSHGELALTLTLTLTLTLILTLTQPYPNPYPYPDPKLRKSPYLSAGGVHLLELDVTATELLHLQPCQQSPGWGYHWGKG